MMNKALLVGSILGGVALVAGTKTVNRQALNLRHFGASEFGVFYPLMSIDLLKNLDEFRERWGYPVVVSKAEGAIGRHDDSGSQHNVNLFGEVRAIDVFPKVASGGYMNTRSERTRALNIARDIGFTGIGIYTDTQPGNLLHLDVRVDRVAGDPALWSRVNGEFGSIASVVA